MGVVTAGLLVAASSTPAPASWRAGAARAGGTLAAAVLGARFDVLPAGGGAPVDQGASVNAASLLASGPVVIDLVNASSEPATVTVVLASAGVVGAVSTVTACSLPWSRPGATCSGTSTTVTSVKVVSLLSSATDTWSLVLPVGGRQHLRVTTGLSVASSVTLAAGAAVSPRDRTLS